MYCPKCGKDMRRSDRDPRYMVCDNCRKKFFRPIEDSYEEDELSKRERVRKQNRGCVLVFSTIFLCLIAIFAVIVCVSIITGKEKSPVSSSSQEAVDLETYYSSLQDQKTALYDLIDKYETGEESAATSAERLMGLSDGINNSIVAISGAKDSDYKSALEAYATALKGVAKHYSEYITTGDQSKMDDVNTLQSGLDELWQAVEDTR